MNTLLKKLQIIYSFSDYEAALIKYGLEAFFYEISKCLLMMVYFYSINKTIEYLVALFLLLLLRSNMGGLHMKHYWSCFFLTFFFMNAAVLILPTLITVTKMEICLILILCTVTNLQVGPVHAKLIKNPNYLLIRKSRLQTSYILILYLILLLILPMCEYSIIGFWVIVLQTIQLIIAKGREVTSHEKSLKKQHLSDL